MVDGLAVLRYVSYHLSPAALFVPANPNPYPKWTTNSTTTIAVASFSTSSAFSSPSSSFCPFSCSLLQLTAHFYGMAAQSCGMSQLAVEVHQLELVVFQLVVDCDPFGEALAPATVECYPISVFSHL